MGYTHYYSQQRSFTDDEWDTFIVAVSYMMGLAQQDMKLTGWDSRDIDSEPLVNDDEVSFNGFNEEGCETFRISREMRAKHDYENQASYDKDGAFECTKTRQRPYDALVVSVLCWLQEYTSDMFRISSDGGKEAIKFMYL